MTDPITLRDGVRLSYASAGNGKQTVLFVHGWACDRHAFAPQMEHFSSAYRVVAPDLRGHGFSDKPEGELAITTHADDLAELIDRLALGEVIAVGHSMGGLCVLQLAAARPDKVRAIVMVDPAPLQVTDEFRAGISAVVSALESGDSSIAAQFIRDGLFLPTSDPALVDQVLATMLATPPRTSAAALRGVLTHDGVAAAALCQVPALHITAAGTLNSPHLMAEWLPGSITGWTVGAGHFNQLEVPTQVTSMIEGFIRHYL